MTGKTEDLAAMGRSGAQGASHEPLLEVKALATGYGKLRVVHDVNFSMIPGETLGIIGRNGMGKTTLMKAIMGLLPVHEGGLTFARRDLTRAPASDRCRLGIGYVPQGRLIFPRLTVEDNLEAGIVATKGSFSKRADEVLQLFPLLKPLLKRRGGSLSGGQQQI